MSKVVLYTSDDGARANVQDLYGRELDRAGHTLTRTFQGFWGLMRALVSKVDAVVLFGRYRDLLPWIKLARSRGITTPVVVVTISDWGTQALPPGVRLVEANGHTSLLPGALSRALSLR